MTAIEKLISKRESQINEVTRLKTLGYDKLGATQFQRSSMKKAFDAVNKTNIDIEKLEYKQSGVISVLKLYLSASKKHTTAIRGYNTYTKGYEIDNKYSVSYIAFHSVDVDTIKKLETEFKRLGINVSIDKNGLQILK